MKKRNYDPGTVTSRRRPTPTEFAHLRKWIDVEEKSIDITNITNLKNINLQLEQTSKLFVSNIISRVIAQLIGAYGDGFVTLAATEDGHLIVQNERESKTAVSVAIAFSDGVDEIIVAGVEGVTIQLTSIMLTVDGETDLIFKDGVADLTGPMDFGGADEPRGMVYTTGFLPWTITEGRSFIIESSNAVQVSGFITGYLD